MFLCSIPGHEYFVDIKVADRTLHTYGEFIITLVGTDGTSEPLKFERFVTLHFLFSYFI